MSLILLKEGVEIEPEEIPVIIEQPNEMPIIEAVNQNIGNQLEVRRRLAHIHPEQ